MYRSVSSKWPMPDYKSHHDLCPDYFYHVHSYLYDYNNYNEYNNQYDPDVKSGHAMQVL